jgi:glyoxylase-like metal-dependent hydrolase (beta-lactamase superfamily II)
MSSTDKKFGEFGDHFELGKSGMPYSSLSDYRPIPADEYGALFLPDRIAKGYHVEEINDGVFYVTQGAYDAMFVATGGGVVVLDTPPLLGENMVRAIREVTDEPVTHLIYSHWHADHIGGAGVFGADVEVIAHEYTSEMLHRWQDLNADRKPVPLPTSTFSTSETLDVNGVKLQLDYKGVNHSPGNIFVYAPRQKVLAAIDIISPGWSVYNACDASENIRGWVEAHDWVLEYDFDALVSGHVNRWGTREDAIESREYVNDIVSFAKEAFAEADDLQFLSKLGISNAWVLWENYMNELTNYTTSKTLTKTTSNGQSWADRLAGADVMTKYHAYVVVEALRLQWGLMTRMEYRMAPPPLEQ